VETNKQRTTALILCSSLMVVHVRCKGTGHLMHLQPGVGSGASHPCMGTSRTDNIFTLPVPAAGLRSSFALLQHLLSVCQRNNPDSDGPLQPSIPVTRSVAGPYS
jgi:hypothetical protein